MFEVEKDNRVNEVIAITKSNSGKSGSKLAKAHMKLDGLLGKSFQGMDSDDTTSLN